MNYWLKLLALAGLAVWPGGLSMSAPPQARRSQTNQLQARRSQASSLRIKTIQPLPNSKTGYACPASCAPIPVRTLLQKNDQEYQQFFNTFKQQSKHCQKQSLRKLAGVLDTQRVPAAVMQAPQYAQADDKSSEGWMSWMAQQAQYTKAGFKRYLKGEETEAMKSKRLLFETAVRGAKTALKETALTGAKAAVRGANKVGDAAKQGAEAGWKHFKTGFKALGKGAKNLGKDAANAADELKKLTACKGSNCPEALKEKISMLQGRLTELEKEAKTGNKFNKMTGRPSAKPFKTRFPPPAVMTPSLTPLNKISTPLTKAKITNKEIKTLAAPFSYSEYAPFSSAEAETKYLNLCKFCARQERRAQKDLLFVVSAANIVHKLHKGMQCSPYQPGEFRKVIPGADLAWPYQVRMEKDGTYSAILPIKFYAGEGYDGPVPRDQAPAYYMNRAQKCLAKANKKLLGPRGEKLQIIVTPPTEDIKNKCAEEIKYIAIGSSDFRSSNIEYSSNISCATILHEMLHIFGLADTYKEKRRGFFVDPKTGKVSEPVANYFDDQRVLTHKIVPAHDCRVTTERNNIMYKHRKRWDSVFDLEDKQSLLEPNQFNVILYGACPINKWHNRCALLSQETSVKNPGCLEEKKLCEQNMHPR